MTWWTESLSSSRYGWWTGWSVLTIHFFFHGTRGHNSQVTTYSWRNLADFEVLKRPIFLFRSQGGNSEKFRRVKRVFRMPKVGKNSKLNRVARRVAASAPLPMAETKDTSQKSEKQQEGENSTGSALSRGQRKRMAKRENYVKKEKMILSTLMLKKQDEQGKRIDGLDAIRQALVDTTKVAAEEEERLQRERKIDGSFIADESDRMNLVMQHPAFKANPFATIQEHLRNSLEKNKKKLEAEASDKRKKNDELKEKRKMEKKERLLGVTKKAKKYKPRRTN